MKLSIITCTYNSEKYLQECIDSIIAQNLDKDIYEHIFVDANSTDSTKKILEEYKNKFKNIKIIEREPKGVYNAMNEGIKEAEGEYILCLNSDDYLENDILSKYLQFIKDTGNKDLYYGKVITLKNGRIVDVLNGNTLFYILGKVFFFIGGGKALIGHPSVLLRRDVFIELGMFDETKKVCSDYGFRLNMMVHKKQFMFFPYVVSYFRVHNDSISSSGKWYSLSKQEDRYFQKKYLPRYQKITSFILNKICNLKGEIVTKMYDKNSLGGKLYKKLLNK